VARASLNNPNAAGATQIPPAKELLATAFFGVFLPFFSTGRAGTSPKSEDIPKPYRLENPI
jgi:hypothetical protein